MIGKFNVVIDHPTSMENHSFSHNIGGNQVSLAGKVDAE